MGKYFDYLYNNFYKVQDKDISDKTLEYINKHRSDLSAEIRNDDNPVANSIRHKKSMARDFMSSPQFHSKEKEYEEMRIFLTEHEYRKDNIAYIKNKMLWDYKEYFDSKDISTKTKNGKASDLKETLLYNQPFWEERFLNSKNEELNLQALEVAKQKNYHAIESWKNHPEKYKLATQIDMYLDKSILCYEEALKIAGTKTKKGFENKMEELFENLYQVKSHILQQWNFDMQWNSEAKLEGYENHAVYLLSQEKTRTKDFKETLAAIKEINSQPKEFVKLRDLCAREEWCTELYEFFPKIAKKEHKELMSTLGNFVNTEKEKNNGRVIIYENEDIYSFEDLKKYLDEYLISCHYKEEDKSLKDKIFVGAKYLFENHERNEQLIKDKKEILKSLYDEYRANEYEFPIETLEKMLETNLLLPNKKMEELYKNTWEQCTKATKKSIEMFDCTLQGYRSNSNIKLLEDLVNKIPKTENSKDIDNLYNEIWMATSVYKEEQERDPLRDLLK